MNRTTPRVFIAATRQNAGTAVAHGVELDAEARPWTFTRLRLSALLVDSRFRDSLEPALEGNYLPQVPRTSVSASGDVRIRAWLAAALILVCAPGAQADQVLEIRNAREIEQLFVRLKYTPAEWQGGVRAVPRIYLADVPTSWREKGSKEIAVAEKKSLFFRLVAPVVLYVNERLLQDRGGGGQETAAPAVTKRSSGTRSSSPASRASSRNVMRPARSRGPKR